MYDPRKNDKVGAHHGSHSAFPSLLSIRDRSFCNLIYAKKIVPFQPFALKGESSEQVIDLVQWLHFWTASPTWIKRFALGEGRNSIRQGWVGGTAPGLNPPQRRSLVELDVVHDRTGPSVLQHGVSGHLTEVHHP